MRSGSSFGNGGVRFARAFRNLTPPRVTEKRCEAGAAVPVYGIGIRGKIAVSDMDVSEQGGPWL